MSDVRPSNPEEKPGQGSRAAEILDAARRVIEAVGIPDTSMERLAEEAGIAKGTIYLYFKNKEDLLVRVVRRSFEQIIEHSREATDRVEGSRAKLRALIETALGHSSEHEAFFQAVGRQAAAGPIGATHLEREFDRASDAYVDFIARFIEQGRAEGTFRDCSNARIALTLAECLRGTIRARYREEDPPSLARETEAILDFFLNGIAARDTE